MALVVQKPLIELRWVFGGWGWGAGTEASRKVGRSMGIDGQVSKGEPLWILEQGNYMKVLCGWVRLTDNMKE